MLNPIAPPPQQGISADGSAPTGFVDVSFSYVYNQTIAGNATLINEVISIYTEADFAWRGLVFTSTGLFAVQFQDGYGYTLSSGLIFSTNLPNTPGDPFPWFPEVVYPAGGRIVLDIEDLSGSTNIVQIIFVGVHRYEVA